MSTVTVATAGPISRIDPATAYSRPTPVQRDLLRLDGNEGLLPSRDLLAALAAAAPELLRRYPDVSMLEATLAARLGVAPDRVIVTAGADEAIDRSCRAFLEPGRTLLVADPTFEMLDRYAALSGGSLARVAWEHDAFPADEYLARLDPRVAIVAIVSPNNPTGGVATLQDVRRIADAAPRQLVLLDHAYVEYADQDLTPSVLDLPNVLVVRTLSKAWGLAGCRVGYAVGSPYMVSVLRAAGGPYPVAAPSVALALTQLERGEPALASHVARIREERRLLSAQLANCGLAVRPSQANFVYVECGPRARLICEGLSARGILVRAFPDRAGLESALRITLPGDSGDFARLAGALDQVARFPEAAS